MYYSSIPQVRSVSGIFENTNISDTFIQSKILQADALINGMISDVYSLPLNIFWQNTIVFSGEGTGADTMTITINSVDYDITISNGLTAGEAADLLRRAIFTATATPDFELGDTDNDETIRITAKDMDNEDQVTIGSTDPQTVAGITVTGGGTTPGAHPLISNISAEIAGAYVLLVAYGKESEDTDKDGYNRLNQAISVLKKIQKKELKLFDGSGNELTTATTARAAYYPNDASSTGDGDEDDTSARFSVNQEF